MSKKNIIVIIVITIVILVLITGWYLWWKVEKESEVRTIWPEEFFIEQSGREKIIKYKNIRVKIPIDWQIEDGIGRASLVFISPNFQLYPETTGPYDPPIAKQGCWIEMAITKENKSDPYNRSSQLKDDIEIYLTHPEDMTEEHYEVIDVSRYKALKYISKLFEIEVEEKNISGKYIFVDIPTDEELYHFETYLFSQDKEKCIQEFDKFLETVVIQ